VAENGLLTVAGLRHGVPAAVPARALPADARGVTPEIPLAGHDCNNFYYKAGCAVRKLLNLSRLNHRLPRCEAHPEVVQGTTEFHHDIADTLLPQADAVFE
jgi:hypothetical protein